MHSVKFSVNGSSVVVLLILLITNMKVTLSVCYIFLLQPLNRFRQNSVWRLSPEEGHGLPFINEKLK